MQAALRQYVFIVHHGAGSAHKPQQGGYLPAALEIHNVRAAALHDGAIQFAPGKQLRQRLRAGLAVAYKFQVIAVLGRGDGALA